MKIVKIGHHCCVRLQKEAIALSKRHDIHLLGHRIPNTVDCFKTISYWKTVEQLIEEVKQHKDADVFHIHNEPNWMVFAVKEALPKKKIILDIHDSMLLRTRDWWNQRTEERAAYEMVDGVVYVNEVCKKIINLKKPSACLPSYVNERDMQYQPWERVGGVVYEGLVQPADGKKVMQYGNYINTCKAFYDSHIPFHIYSPKMNDEKTYNTYKDICFVEKAIHFKKLLIYLGMYDWGLVGNIDKHKEWAVASPNKLFEYMAAGIPIVAINAKWCEKFVKKYKVGIVVKSAEELRERWDERKECQEKVLLNRRNFTMEKHIKAVEKLYEQVI